MDTLHSFLHGENHENSLKINRNLLGNNDQQTTSSSIYKHEKWFIMYGFTQAHSESDKINENEGITCSDNIKATYAKGVKANTCLSTTLKGHSGYIKITCHRRKLTIIVYMEAIISGADSLYFAQSKPPSLTFLIVHAIKSIPILRLKNKSLFVSQVHPIYSLVEEVPGWMTSMERAPP
jgi:hypothetical protein